jgi:hypothetical protein
MKKSTLLLLGILIIGMFCVSSTTFVKEAQEEEPLIQLAILLDTSGSMQGLIEQAKTQLWKIVNEMALAKQKGKSPRLEVALYEYGKSSIPASEDYLRQIVPLSTDLDRLSEELFKLRTNGGSEFCGAVIQSAVKGLRWTTSANRLKIIFIAGNEPFTQGKVDYRQACKGAIEKGIMVNTIFCGDYQTGIRTNWKDGADLADGKYMNIDHNRRITHISAPQDKLIAELGKEINATYLAYGKGGYLKKERQKAQDSNAAALNEAVMVQRSVAKASKQYRNVDWDLVDATKDGKVKVEDVPEEELPKEMKNMSKDERKKYVEAKAKKRAEIQAKINQLRKERDKYISEQRKSNAEKGTLDDAIINAIRVQAKKKKFKFEKDN